MARQGSPLPTALKNPFHPVLFAALLFFSCLAATSLRADPAPSASGPPLVRLDDVGVGSLLLKTNEPGRYVPAPLLGTRVDIRVSGPVARAEVRQEFFNPTQSWLEATYAFPLPETAAVEHMRIVAGEVVIEAKIAEREAARRTYETARDLGRRAGLVERYRPNVFTTAVANIAPMGSISVEIRYRQTVRYDSGEYRLRFPMVIGPRYFPAETLLVAGGTGRESVAVSDDDQRAFGSPVLRPEAGKINPVTLSVALDAGMPLADLKSPHHKIEAEDWTGGRTIVRLADGPVPADRDFELTWRPAPSATPLAALFRETGPDGTYLLAVLMPPQGGAGPVPPRDLIFILDKSGSMEGTLIAQAKAALAQAFARLRPEDGVNLIRFSHTTDVLFPDVRPADAATLRRVQAYVAETRADGGTEMLAPVRLALASDARPGRLQQIVLLTDGAVGNEDAILAEIRSRIGARRLFTIGIGSAPNSYLMRKAAEYGRGSHVHIGAQDQIAERMAQLLEKLERPAVTGIEARWPRAAGGTVEAFPRTVPDLYHGEPVVFVAKLEGSDSAALPTFAGQIGGKAWTHAFTAADARPGDGVASLWARSKIEALMDSTHDGVPMETVRAAVIETALRHSLTTKFTSLVAVEEQRVRPEGAPVDSAQVPHNLPRGWDYDKVFGERLLRRVAPRQRDAGLAPARDATQSASAAPAAAGAAFVKVAAATATPLQGQAVTLPQGGTSGPLEALAGVALLLIAVGAWIARRRA
jgi:Ca-activated chloride channel family protein